MAIWSTGKTERQTPVPARDFAAVVLQHQRMVFSIALRVIGVYETAEEVAQDVFLELHRTSPRLDGDDHLRAWLRRVSVNRSIDALRRVRRQPVDQAEMWDEALESAPDGTAGLDPALAARLDDLLRTLPEAQRIAVVLRFGESMWPEEIAAMLNQPLETVKSNLKRGLALLRRKAQITMKEYVREPA